MGRIFFKRVTGFAYTPPLFKVMNPNGMKNYKQETLAGSVLDATYYVIMQKKDVDLLQRLVFEKGIGDILLSILNVIYFKFSSFVSQLGGKFMKKENQ